MPLSWFMIPPPFSNLIWVGAQAGGYSNFLHSLVGSWFLFVYFFSPSLDYFFFSFFWLPQGYGVPRPRTKSELEIWPIYHSCGNARSLTHCVGLGTELVSLLLQRHHRSHWATAGSPGPKFSRKLNDIWLDSASLSLSGSHATALSSGWW